MEKKQQSDKKKKWPPNTKLKKLVDEQWSIQTFAIKIGEARVQIEQERNKIRGIEKTENTVSSYEPSPRTIRRWFSGESFPQAEYREAIYRLFPGKSSADLGFDLPEDQLALVDQEPEEPAQVSFTGQASLPRQEDEEDQLALVGQEPEEHTWVNLDKQASLPRQEDEEDQLALVVDQELEEHAPVSLNGQASLPRQGDERNMRQEQSNLFQEQSHASLSSDTQRGIGSQSVRQKWYQSRWKSIGVGAMIVVLLGAIVLGYNFYASAASDEPDSGGQTQQCHSTQAKSIGPVTVSLSSPRLPTTYVVDLTSPCWDISFKPVKANSQVEARVVFLDKTTGAVKGYGERWRSLASSTWIVLAKGIVRTTHYTLEFRGFTEKVVIEGEIAA